MAVRAVLKKIIAEQFKGFVKVEYDFFNRTRITGRNGAGKTTLADGYFWVPTDKDYSLTSNPDVHPDFLTESEPSVTLVYDIDGKEVEFRKYQKDSRTKKQIEEGAPVRISNHFEINSVPKSQRDFVSALEEYGIDVDKILLLSHPDIFTEQKSADCRKILFGMVGNITDKEIADSLPDCGDVGGLLEQYKIDEIVAMKKREYKQATEALESLPEQIIGMEKSKVEINESELQAQKKTLQDEIAVLETQIAELGRQSIGDLNQELVSLEREQRNMVTEANSARVAKLTELDAIIGQKKFEYKQLVAERDGIDASLKEAQDIQKDKQEEFNALSQKYQQVKESEFDMSAQKCPYCGQDLPVYQIDKAHKAFEENKKKSMLDINREAKDVQDRARDAGKLIVTLSSLLEEKDKTIEQAIAEIDLLYKEREKYETAVKVADTPEYKELSDRIAEVHEKIARYDQLKVREDNLRLTLKDRLGAVADIDRTLGTSIVNEHIDRQIAEAKSKQRELRQAKSDAENVLNQIQRISMEKNKRLTDEVNKHFEIVKFKLFEQQKNLEYKDCCIPTIRNEDGVYRVFGESANTALEIRGKLDIISGLQKFYGQYLPVWVDGFECIDSENAKAIHMDTQLITLSVSDGSLTVEGE